MRLANVGGRTTIVIGPGAGVDVHRASGGRFGPEPRAVYALWSEFLVWARSSEPGPVESFDPHLLGPPSPEPTQVFAFGLNYRAHASEAGFDAPDGLPPVFTKFRSALTGPVTTVELPRGGTVDWEVELVAVIGLSARHVAVEDAWDHVAGLTVGNDFSERTAQLRPPAPQFSLGKSLPGFAPTGPWLVTADEFADRDDIALGCEIDGEEVQFGRTSDLIMPIPELVAELSKTLTLLPGDLLFTGTPEGVGVGREPQRFLRPGERVRTWVEGIGELEQTFVASPD